MKVLMRGPSGRVFSVHKCVVATLESLGWARVFERPISIESMMRSNRSVCG
jgi:hypothetical protein